MNSKKIDKYQYIKKTPVWLLRTIYVYAIFSWILVIIGYSHFITIDILYLWLLGPVVLYFTCYYFISYSINLFYRRLDIKEHRRLVRRFWKEQSNLPNIDIFLPICGEDTDVLQKTFHAVSKLNYKNKKVYVLDDRGIKEHKSLAKKFRFVYMSRENKGYMKKAGNIKHGYENSDGDFIIIYDADFAPHPDFIRELLPYMSDPQVAIVQSPQYFQTNHAVHKRSMLEYGASNVQEDFYRFIQVARDMLGVPICCGSNAIYRRKALDTIGGTTQIEHSEDMHTGFDLMNKGWRVRYIPIILAVGLCPDNLHAYFHQQHRWCSGSLSLMLDKKFWKSNLSFVKKMCFISGFMYYMSYPVTILLSLDTFLVLFRYGTFISISNSLFFIPCLIFSFIIMPFFRISKPRPGNFLARSAFAYSYCHAVITAFIKKSVGWQPTNVVKMTVSKAFKEILLFNTFYSIVYISLIGVAIGQGKFQIFNINHYLILFWILFNIFQILMMLLQFYFVLDTIKVKEMKAHKIDNLSLFLWRLKIVGSYVLIVAIILATTISISSGYYMTSIHANII